MNFILLAVAFALGVLYSIPNFRPFFRRFGLLALCLGPALFAVACTAAWLSTISAMLPSLTSLVESIVAFVVGLSGKTVAASVVTGIQNIANDIAAEITNAQTLIADYQSSPSTTTLGKIQSVFQGIVASLGNILSGANITDSATVSKLTQLVGLAVAAAQAIIGLIPLVASVEANQSQYTTAQLKAMDKQGAETIAFHHKQLCDGYKLVLSEKTGSEVVDTVVATLPRELK